MSFVPTNEFPWFRHVMGRKGPRFPAAALADNAAVAERVLERIRAEGPLSSRDFERLGAYLRFAKADRIEWPTGLRSEKRLFGTASPT